MGKKRRMWGYFQMAKKGTVTVSHIDKQVVDTRGHSLKWFISSNMYYFCAEVEVITCLFFLFKRILCLYTSFLY